MPFYLTQQLFLLNLPERELAKTAINLLSDTYSFRKFDEVAGIVQHVEDAFCAPVLSFSSRIDCFGELSILFAF
jgi:hypothetical protein